MAHLLVLEAVVVVVDAVEVVAEPRPAVAAHEALLVVVVRPRQDRVRLDQLRAGVAGVCSRDTEYISTRASKEGSRTFHNHGEGSY